jgi:hypothetical protein
MKAQVYGWRARMRSTPVGLVVLRTLVFAVGGLFVALGAVLVVLPGPLTIPPVLLGVYIWSTEFAWAERLRGRVAASARTAWAATRRRPVVSALSTLAGLAMAGGAVVAVRRYDLVGRALDAFG